MAKTYSGIVPLSEGNAGRDLFIQLDPGVGRPPAGSRVRVTVVRPTDEEIGKRLRKMLQDGISKMSVKALAEDVETDAGWPILAELIREVADT